MNEKATKPVVSCMTCGGENITQRSQVSVNTKEIDPIDPDDYWCEDCDAEVDVYKKYPIEKRFITVENYDGTVTAFTEREPWQKALEKNETPGDAAACWVWQFAGSKEQAVDQHYEKHALWEADSNAGRKQQTTY